MSTKKLEKKNTKLLTTPLRLSFKRKIPFWKKILHGKLKKKKKLRRTKRRQEREWTVEKLDFLM